MESSDEMEMSRLSSNVSEEYQALNHSQTAFETTQNLDKAHQIRRLLSKRTFRWIVTVGFIAAIVATLKIYERKRNFSSGQKTVFNTIITALILGLGLNLFVSCNFAEAKRMTA